MQEYKKYLQPKHVSQLSSLELKARLVVEGFITGMHRSPYHGFSVEFAEHRQYQQGDELRYIDWKVFARTNKYFVKQFEEETNLRALIAVDVSGSMGYASKGNISKLEYATYLAASLSYLIIKQKDACGLAIYHNEVVDYLPPRAKISYIQEILQRLDSITPSNTTNTASALHSLVERISRRGIVILISDFFDDVDKINQSIRHFRHNNHEVIALQLLDPREIDFKFGFATAFKDMETGEEMSTVPNQIQHSYKTAIEQHCNAIRSICRKQKVDYHLITTDQPFDIALREYMVKRNSI